MTSSAYASAEGRTTIGRPGSGRVANSDLEGGPGWAFRTALASTSAGF